MKKLLIAYLLCLPMVALASGGNIVLDNADINPENKMSLRHGAKLFVNYCMSCHSASFVRYSRVAKDLSMTDEQVINNLMFVANFDKLDSGEAKKIGDQMTIAMKRDDGKKYFGTTVPDLSLVARVRGADWLYTYLTTFYIDEKRPFGMNNVAFPNVGMPHVLWELEGLKKRVPDMDESGKIKKDDHGHEMYKFEQVTKGSMNEVEYKAAMNDLVNFMVYMGEPVKLERQRIGIYVMFFLLVFFIVAYFLKKEYWKDVH